MANIKSEGKVFDANLIIETGSTLTAGNLIWADISGTNVVRNLRSYTGTDGTVESASPATGNGVVSLDGQITSQTGVFLGVICNTQTGVANLSGGHQTGVSWYTKGVFQFNTTPTASCIYTVGVPVWAINADTVGAFQTGISKADSTATNSTGSNPIGVIESLPFGPVTTNTVARKINVKIYPNMTIQRFA